MSDKEDMITANLNGKEGYPWIDLTVRVAVEAIDVTPLRYTYSESDEPIDEELIGDMEINIPHI